MNNSEWYRNRGRNLNLNPDCIPNNIKYCICGWYPYELCEVFSPEVVVCFDEDLPESTLPDRVVLGVEFVEPVERIPVLKIQTSDAYFLATVSYLMISQHGISDVTFSRRVRSKGLCHLISRSK